jgi:hypothetical protein
MAILIEGISVVVRRDAIKERFAGGWDRFLEQSPPRPICYDDEVVGIVFLNPIETESYVSYLEEQFLIFVESGMSVDIAVVDQLRGVVIECPWLRFAHLPFCDKGKVSAVWFFDALRAAPAIHPSGEQLRLVTPSGWKFEQSMSAQHTFIPTEDVAERLMYLRTENDVDVYWDSVRNTELYM